MILRRNIYSRNYANALVHLFVMVSIPLMYYFELFMILPHYYPLWTPWYTFHFICGTFILLNICSNYVAIVICDTSIRGRMLPTVLSPESRFCEVCECIAPPRSWHCPACNICVLKRDHHCVFTSCCIGHDNLRYFIVFVSYMFVAGMYASYYNTFFAFQFANLASLEAIFKLTVPIAILFTSYSRYQIYLFVIFVVSNVSVLTGFLLYYHGHLVFRGIVTHEKREESSMYDYGPMQNIKISLGEKWYLVWLAPFVESKLTHDGINWQPKQSVKPN